MIDEFKGKPINAFKEQLAEIHCRVHTQFKTCHTDRVYVNIEDLHTILHVIESMGDKIAQLSQDIHEIKNRSTSE